MPRIIRVDEENRDEIIKQLRQNLLYNYFVIYDLLYKPERTTVFGVYNNGSLKAYLLIYRGLPTDFFAPRWLAVRLEGEEKFAQELLRYFPNENLGLLYPPALQNLISREFPEVPGYAKLYMMRLTNDRYLITQNIVERLKPKHASLLSQLYLLWQRPADEKSCKELLGNKQAFKIYGIFVGKKLVSAAIARQALPNEVWEIRGVFTSPEYRKRGFGTQVTSAATMEASKHAPFVTLCVVGEVNQAAINIYQKLGYETAYDWHNISVHKK